MATERVCVPVDEERRILQTLIQDAIRPDKRFAYFFTTGEGRQFPDSTMEEASGYVITDRGRTFSFWFGPEPGSGRPSLTRWTPACPESWWATTAEYREARESVGLTEHIEG